MQMRTNMHRTIKIFLEAQALLTQIRGQMTLQKMYYMEKWKSLFFVDDFAYQKDCPFRDFGNIRTMEESVAPIIIIIMLVLTCSSTEFQSTVSGRNIKGFKKYQAPKNNSR